MNQIEVSPGGVQALSNNLQNLSSEVSSAEEGMAIVVNGDTAPKAISKGQYLFIKNHSTLATGGYHATAAISSGQSVAGSVAADINGVCNALNNTTKLIPITSATDLDTLKSNSDDRIKQYYGYDITQHTNIPEGITWANGKNFSLDVIPMGSTYNQQILRVYGTTGAPMIFFRQQYYVSSSSQPFGAWYRIIDENALNSNIANKLSFNAIGGLTSSQSVSFTVKDGTFGMLALVGTSTGRCGLYLFRTSSSLVYVSPIHDSDVGTSVNVATNGFTVTLTSSSASGSGVYAMLFSGGLAT